MNKISSVVTEIPVTWSFFFTQVSNCEKKEQIINLLFNLCRQLTTLNQNYREFEMLRMNICKLFQCNFCKVQ